MSGLRFIYKLTDRMRESNMSKGHQRAQECERAGYPVEGLKQTGAAGGFALWIHNSVECPRYELAERFPINPEQTGRDAVWTGDGSANGTRRAGAGGFA